MNAFDQPAGGGQRIQAIKTRSCPTETADSNLNASFIICYSLVRFLGLLLLTLAPAVGRAQFNYSKYDDGIMIDRYTDPKLAIGAELRIPSAIDGLPVTHIGEWAFRAVTNLARVTIPRSVIHIEAAAFAGRPDLEAITVDPLNPSYTSMDGVLFYEKVSTLMQYPGGKEAFAAFSSAIAISNHQPTTTQ